MKNVLQFISVLIALPSPRGSDPRTTTGFTRNHIGSVTGLIRSRLHNLCLAAAIAAGIASSLPLQSADRESYYDRYRRQDRWAPPQSEALRIQAKGVLRGISKYEVRIAALERAGIDYFRTEVGWKVTLPEDALLTEVYAKRDQRDRNACLAYALDALCTSYYFNKHNRVIRFSAAFPCNAITAGGNDGLLLEEGKRFFQYVGAVPEMLFPSGENNDHVVPEKELFGVARLFRLPGYVTVWDRESGQTDLNLIRLTLALGRTVVVCMWAPRELSDHRDGVWEHDYPSIPSMHPGYERHAAVLLGYDAKKRAFLFQNAWQGWGLGATQYGWISYETFRHGVYHAFTYADEEFCLR